MKDNVENSGINGGGSYTKNFRDEQVKGSGSVGVSLHPILSQNW